MFTCEAHVYEMILEGRTGHNCTVIKHHKSPSACQKSLLPTGLYGRTFKAYWKEFTVYNQIFKVLSLGYKFELLAEVTNIGDKRSLLSMFKTLI